MRYITISIDGYRVARQRRIWPNIEVFPGTEGCTADNYRQVCIPDAYRRVAVWAVAEGLGRESIVMQDDVWLPHGAGFDNWQAGFDTSLLIFGRTEPSGIVVPKAFSATPEVWLLLQQVWDGTGRIGPAWQPVVEEYGLVLDVTKGLGN